MVLREESDKSPLCYSVSTTVGSTTYLRSVSGDLIGHLRRETRLGRYADEPRGTSETPSVPPGLVRTRPFLALRDIGSDMETSRSGFPGGSTNSGTLTESSPHLFTFVRRVLYKSTSRRPLHEFVPSKTGIQLHKKN